MLAQSFKSADELGISEMQKDALAKTLVLLETGRLTHAPSPVRETDGYRESDEFTGHFNMARWRAAEECGTVCCIAGTAELVGTVTFDPDCDDNEALFDLFWVGDSQFGGDISHITPEQAARALRSYLTTGKARWDLALASS